MSIELPVSNIPEKCAVRSNTGSSRPAPSTGDLHKKGYWCYGASSPALRRASVRLPICRFVSVFLHTCTRKHTHQTDAQDRLGQPDFPFPLPPVLPGLELQDGESLLTVRLFFHPSGFPYSPPPPPLAQVSEPRVIEICTKDILSRGDFCREGPSRKGDWSVLVSAISPQCREKKWYHRSHPSWRGVGYASPRQERLIAVFFEIVPRRHTGESSRSRTKERTAPGASNVRRCENVTSCDQICLLLLSTPI